MIANPNQSVATTRSGYWERSLGDKCLICLGQRTTHYVVRSKKHSDDFGVKRRRSLSQKRERNNTCTSILIRPWTKDKKLFYFIADKIGVELALGTADLRARLHVLLLGRTLRYVQLDRALKIIPIRNQLADGAYYCMIMTRVLHWMTWRPVFYWRYSTAAAVHLLYVLRSY